MASNRNYACIEHRKGGRLTAYGASPHCPFCGKLMVYVAKRPRRTASRQWKKLEAAEKAHQNENERRAANRWRWGGMYWQRDQITDQNEYVESLPHLGRPKPPEESKERAARTKRRNRLRQSKANR